jgi:hypothetical protein
MGKFGIILRLSLILFCGIGILSCSKEEMMERKIIGNWKVVSFAFNDVSVNMSDTNTTAYLEFEDNIVKMVSIKEGNYVEDYSSWRYMDGRIIIASEGEGIAMLIKQLTNKSLVVVIDRSVNDSELVDVTLTFEKVR